MAQGEDLANLANEKPVINRNLIEIEDARTQVAVHVSPRSPRAPRLPKDDTLARAWIYGKR